MPKAIVYPTSYEFESKGFAHPFWGFELKGEYAFEFDAHTREGLPYPWCWNPGVCRHRHSCPRDPNCGD